VPSALSAKARAKINFALHVLGRRRDGFHDLDSIVAFAEFGDTVAVEPCRDLSIEVSGPASAGVPADERNVAAKAARMLSANLGAKIKIEKWIPAASGLGGGSSDAAAALRLLSKQWGVSIGPISNFARVGADVPVCLAGGCSRIRGAGETVELLEPGWPELPLVLANAGKEVSTTRVFQGVKRFGGALVGEIPGTCSVGELAAWLENQRNDLESPALSIAPEIRDVLSQLSSCRGCLLARMSGSGGTCFGIFESSEAAVRAKRKVHRANSSWWCIATKTSAIGRKIGAPEFNTPEPRLF